MRMYKPFEFAAEAGVCVKTLQDWDRAGKFPARRLPSGRRYYTDEDLERFRSQGQSEPKAFSGPLLRLDFDAVRNGKDAELSVIWNKKYLSDMEVRNMLVDGSARTDARCVILPRRKADFLFGNVKEEEDEA